MGLTGSKSKYKHINSNNQQLLDDYNHNYNNHNHNHNYNNDNQININNNNILEPLRFEITKLKEDNQKIKVELKSLRDKNEKLETEINKIQTNHGKEIFALNEAFSSLQKDTVTLINNQKIISEVLHKLSEDNDRKGYPINNNQTSLIRNNIENSFYNSVHK